MEARRLHEEFSVVSKGKNGAANLVAEACLHHSLVNFSTNKMDADAVFSGLKHVFFEKFQFSISFDLIKIF